MTIRHRLVAATAVLLALAASACSPARAPDPTAPTASAPAETAAPTAGLAPQAAATPGPDAALPASCQTLLASMQSCADNLTRGGSPMGEGVRNSITDMRDAISRAPPAEVASFCDTQASAFAERAQAAHC